MIALVENNLQALQSDSAAISAPFSDRNVPLKRSRLSLGAARQQLPTPAKARPTIEELREYLDYEPETGILRWRKACGCVKAGAIAGSVNSGGYFSLRFNGIYFLAHRVGFALHHGRWPHPCCDHIDGNTQNNCADNLRECSFLQNQQNRRMARNNTSGVKGVRRNRNGWLAHVKLHGSTHGKYFRHLADAAAWVKQTREQLHGEFARH